MRTVIFDLDGTLADTGADLLEAANACFRALGHGDVLDIGTDKATALRGGRAMLKLGFGRLGIPVTDALLVAQYRQLLGHYGERIDVHTVLYPGVEDAVKGLSARGYAVAVCTNKPEYLAETLLQRLGARDWFGALTGGDTLPVRKPDPAHYHETLSRVGGTLSQSLLVGDTDTDRDTARNAGVPSVLVTFGPGDGDVRDLAPEALLHHYDDLHDVVSPLIG